MYGEGDTNQESSEFGANNIPVSWEFTPEDLNFSLFGYFTSKDKNIGVNRSTQSKVWFYSQYLRYISARLSLFTLVYKGLLYFLESSLLESSTYS